MKQIFCFALDMKFLRHLLLLFPFWVSAQNITLDSLRVPPRELDAETGSHFMNRVAQLSLEDREMEIFKALSAGNLPDFLRGQILITVEEKDALGNLHQLTYSVTPDYLAIGSNSDYCRIPMNPHTAQRLATIFGTSLITAKISDEINQRANIRLQPFFYKPVGRENESVKKFVLHHNQIETQKANWSGKNGHLISGIKKDVILSTQIKDKRDRVVIYGWHKVSGEPIQPVYSGHVDWYVDYSHGIRLMNDQVILDGAEFSITEILKDPVLFKLISNEDKPMEQPFYTP